MSQNLSPANKLIQSIRTDLKANFKEREALADGMLTALLSRQHAFVLGPPGTAKSLICETLAQAIGGEYFSWLCSKFTTPEELFGPLSMQGLKEDRYERITTHKLPSCQIAFLDEVFKGSSAILNTLLSVMNERKFYNGSKPTAIPLQSIFAASNEIPQGEELAPMYDRFALRYQVDRILDEGNMRDLLNKAGAVSVTSISLQQLADAQAEVEKLQIPSLVIDKLIELRRKVADEEFYVSDRKWMQSISLAKAYAYLNGHSAVEVEDLMILENALWTQPDQIPEIRKIVRKICNPLAEEIQRHLDAAREVMAQSKAGKIPDLEAFNKLQTSKKHLDGLYARSNNEKVRETSEYLGKLCKDLSERMFNSPKR